MHTYMYTEWNIDTKSTVLQWGLTKAIWQILLWNNANVVDLYTATEEQTLYTLQYYFT